MLNLNYLYFQSTPMTEALFIMTLTASIYYLYKWTTDRKISSLIFASFFTLLSSFNRYEGWLLAFLSSVIFIAAFLKNKFDKKFEGLFIIFSTLSLYGIFLWLLWGTIILHDPFEFLNNKLSAGNQTKIDFVSISPTGKKEIVSAITTNLLAIKHTSGYISLILLIVGLIYYIFSNKKHLTSFKTLIIILSLTPLFFDILTVYLGDVPVEVPELSKQIPPGNYFNIRYSLYSLPAIAIFTAYLCQTKILSIVISTIILLNYFFLMPTNPQKIVAFADAGANHDTQIVKKQHINLSTNTIATVAIFLQVQEDLTLPCTIWEYT